MILNTGEYVHIIHRQLFAADGQRHFVGTVEGHEEWLPLCDGFNAQSMDVYIDASLGQYREFSSAGSGSLPSD